jgi:hypothetical protein
VIIIFRELDAFEYQAWKIDLILLAAKIVKKW